MEVFLLLMVFASVASIQSAIVTVSEANEPLNIHESSDMSSSEDFDSTELENMRKSDAQERFRKYEAKSRSMTAEDLKKKGYPQTGLKFSTPLEENIYFVKKYKTISETKCYRYKNELLRQRFLKEEKTGPQFGIVGGQKTSIIQHPYVGALGFELKPNKLNFLCGCTLISHHFALTAGHCTLKATNHGFIEPKIVRFGATKILQPTERYDYKPYIIIKHPKYKPPKKYNDIALIYIKEKIEFNEFVKPACLWRSYDTSSLSHISVLGWGTVDPDNMRTTDTLQIGGIDILNRTMCKVLNNRNNRIRKDHICAGKLGRGVDSCQGDSGGPLQGFSNGTYYVVGIVSYGRHCGRKNIPGIYTRVSSFILWIEEIVWNNME